MLGEGAADVGEYVGDVQTEALLGEVALLGLIVILWKPTLSEVESQEGLVFLQRGNHLFSLQVGEDTAHLKRKSSSVKERDLLT